MLVVVGILYIKLLFTPSRQRESSVINAARFPRWRATINDNDRKATVNTNYILFYFIMFLFRALALLSGWVVSSIPPSFCLFHFCFYFYLCFIFFLIIVLFLFLFLFLFISYSLFQCISVADVCMLCLSYPVLGHDITLSNALRCIIPVS